MRTHVAIALAALIWSGSIPAQEVQSPATPDPQKAPAPIASPVMTKALPDYPGKEAQVLVIEYPPGAIARLHHHDAHVFIYVLEGALQMGVKGTPVVNLSPGQSWYEGPHDVHTIGRNASQTKPARFVAFFLKDAGKAPVLPGE